MEEADRLCKQLYIIDRGKVVANGSPPELKREVGADSIKLNLENIGSKEEMNVRARQILKTVNGVTSVMDSEDGLTVYAKNAGFVIAEIVRTLDSDGIRLSSVSFSSPTLDDVFLQHTGRRIRPEELNMRQRSGFRFGARRPARE